MRRTIGVQARKLFQNVSMILAITLFPPRRMQPDDACRQGRAPMPPARSDARMLLYSCEHLITVGNFHSYLSDY